MYYKVLKNNKVVDVLDNLVYFKWQPKHKIMILTDRNDAQAILSSDKNIIWHEKTLCEVPVNGFDTVEVVEIDENEYRKLKILSLTTPEEIIDNFVLFLLEDNII